MADRFRGTTAIVTGAASGIGRALADLLLERGATVYATDRDEQSLGQLAAAHAGRGLTTAVVDVSDRSAVAAVIDRAVSDCGRLDFMFNNAGIVVGGDFAEMTDEAWRRIVDVNFWGVVYGTELAYVQMRRQGSGHIVNTSSSAGVLPVPHSAAYAATKHAVVGLSTSLRAEAAPHGIGVSVVLPGLVDTGIFDSATNLAGHDYKASIDAVPLAKITPLKAAEQILRGAAKNKQFVAFPAYNRLLIGLNRIMPNVMAPIITRGATR
ncbi:MAG: SDR family oxidoreductase [Actinomycetia bacterium]|nr:SDR family oxidoreductase [Actinomycetes bacterium]